MMYHAACDVALWMAPRRQGHALAAWSSQEAATAPKSYCGQFYGLGSKACHIVGEEATAPKCYWGQFHKQQALLHRVGGLGSKASHVAGEEASLLMT